MLIIAALIFGALFGVLRARNRGGNRLDKAQYAAVHAIIFGVIAIFASIIIYR
ncbi:hypothetical protein [Aliiroseovarius sp. 2305UL8-7]|uniref:hypothetical protein n=1 Tax=Aliiroseovarius conchicola TaxID=3121637 RepID=UPI003528205D